MKVLGVDPGTTRMGYGLIESEGPRLIDYGVLEIKGMSPIKKIGELSRAFQILIRRLKPDIAGVETIFFSKNKKTALSVAHARGVLISLLLAEGIQVCECSPQEVKLAVAGYGNADKVAVASLAKKILGVRELTGYDDASDAVAIALTTAAREGFARRAKNA